jgi:hypothetical protein
MISLATAFLLDHFDAGMGWWWAFGLVFALDFLAIVVKAMQR